MGWRLTDETPIARVDDLAVRKWAGERQRRVHFGELVIEGTRNR